MIPALGDARFARVDADAHSHAQAARPVDGSKCPLCGQRCGSGIAGAAEGKEERVALGVDLEAAVRFEGLSQHPPVRLQ